MASYFKPDWRDLADEVHASGRELTAQQFIEVGAPAGSARRYLRNLLREEPDSWILAKAETAEQHGRSALKLAPINTEGEEGGGCWSLIPH